VRKLGLTKEACAIPSSRTEVTQVHVTYDPVEVATEQLKTQEHQRVLGIVHCSNTGPTGLLMISAK
jgi:hypothetical protein